MTALAIVWAMPFAFIVLQTAVQLLGGVIDGEPALRLVRTAANDNRKMA